MGTFRLTFPNNGKTIEVYVFFHEAGITMRMREKKLIDNVKIEIDYVDE